MLRHKIPGRIFEPWHAAMFRIIMSHKRNCSIFLKVHKEKVLTASGGDWTDGTDGNNAWRLAWSRIAFMLDSIYV